MALDDGRHPDAEQLAEYADGVLSAGVRAEVEQHLVNCPDCRAVLTETMAFVALGPEKSRTNGAEPGSRVLPFRSRRWMAGVAAGLAAAAALVVVVRLSRPDVSAPASVEQPSIPAPSIAVAPESQISSSSPNAVYRVRSDRPELQELVAAVANEPTRPVEGRLTGGFRYAPPPSPTRGPGDRDVSPDVRIAAATIEKRAQASETSENKAALGVAHLTLGDFDKAIVLLGAAAAARPSFAPIQSDLAAAFLARAGRTRGREDFEAAREAADRALAADPANAPAAFNRALALEGLGSGDAREAWTKARALQEDVGWRAEADRHLAAVSDRSGR